MGPDPSVASLRVSSSRSERGSWRARAADLARVRRPAGPPPPHVRTVDDREPRGTVRVLERALTRPDGSPPRHRRGARASRRTRPHGLRIRMSCERPAAGARDSLRRPGASALGGERQRQHGGRAGRADRGRGEGERPAGRPPGRRRAGRSPPARDVGVEPEAAADGGDPLRGVGLRPGRGGTEASTIAQRPTTGHLQVAGQPVGQVARSACGRVADSTTTIASDARPAAPVVEHLDDGLRPARTRHRAVGGVRAEQRRAAPGRGRGR